MIILESPGCVFFSAANLDNLPVAQSAYCETAKVDADDGSENLCHEGTAKVIVAISCKHACCSVRRETDLRTVYV